MKNQKKGAAIFKMLLLAAAAALIVLFSILMGKINSALAYNDQVVSNYGYGVSRTQAVAPFIALVFVVIVTLIVTASFAYRKELREDRRNDHFSNMESLSGMSGISKK